MKVLILNASRLEATEGIAFEIAASFRKLGLDAASRPVNEPGDIAALDAFIIGSAIYGGRWLREAIDFVLANEATLADHPVWLFSSGPVGRAATIHGPPEPKEIPQLRVGDRSTRSPHVRRRFGPGKSEDRALISCLAWAISPSVDSPLLLNSARSWPSRSPN